MSLVAPKEFISYGAGVPGFVGYWICKSDRNFALSCISVCLILISVRYKWVCDWNLKVLEKAFLNVRSAWISTDWTENSLIKSFSHKLCVHFFV
jgi:hypothetical protein